MNCPKCGRKLDTSSAVCPCSINDVVMMYGCPAPNPMPPREEYPWTRPVTKTTGTEINSKKESPSLEVKLLKKISKTLEKILVKLNEGKK